VAQVRGLDVREVVGQLSGELCRRHRLVVSEGSERLGNDGRRATRYRFRHILFQDYVYGGLDEGERSYLHEAVGQALETLYAGQSEAVAAQLARHFEVAEDEAKAAKYLLQAGDRARLAYAHQEAIGHYQRALALLKGRGEYERAARTLMKLGLTYHAAFQYQEAQKAYEEGFALWQRVGREPPAAAGMPAPHALRLQVTESPQLLDPALSYATLVSQLYSGLVHLGPEMDIVPDLAQRWEIADGGRRYTFYLRDDARWSDGTPVTAGDFVYAWRRLLDPGVGSLFASLLYDVEGARAYNQGHTSAPEHVGVQALDDHTLVVAMERPASYFLHVLACSPCCSVPRHAIEAHGEAWVEPGNIVTNGPFQVEGWTADRCLVFGRDVTYHGQFTGNLERVELSLLTEEEMIGRGGLVRYVSGDLDILPFSSLEADLDWQQYAGEIISGPGLATELLLLDTGRRPFDDLRVRRALALATDKERLTVAWHGYPSPATGGFVPPGMPGHSSGIGLPYDPERARQLLAEAGYPGGRGFPKIEAHYPNPAPPLESLQEQWRQVLGIEVVWQGIDGGTFVSRSSKTLPHLCMVGWDADFADPDNFLAGGVDGLRGWTNWRDETYDRLVETARRELETHDRIRLYQRADRILVQEAAIIPVGYSQFRLLVKPWVKRYPVPAMSGSFWQYVVIEPH
jgi:ABC-type oligopeptide transport system substrate-binding subunit